MVIVTGRKGEAMGLIDDVLRKALRRAKEEDVIYRSDAMHAALNVCKRSPSKSMHIWYSISALPSATQTTTWLGSYCPYQCEKCGRYVDSKEKYCPKCGRKAVRNR